MMPSSLNFQNKNVYIRSCFERVHSYRRFVKSLHGEIGSQVNLNRAEVDSFLPDTQPVAEAQQEETRLLEEQMSTSMDRICSSQPVHGEIKEEKVFTTEVANHFFIALSS